MQPKIFLWNEILDIPKSKLGTSGFRASTKGGALGMPGRRRHFCVGKVLDQITVQEL